MLLRYSILSAWVAGHFPDGSGLSGRVPHCDASKTSESAFFLTHVIVY